MGAYTVIVPLSSLMTHTDFFAVRKETKSLYYEDRNSHEFRYNIGCQEFLPHPRRRVKSLPVDALLQNR